MAAGFGARKADRFRPEMKIASGVFSARSNIALRRRNPIIIVSPANDVSSLKNTAECEKLRELQPKSSSMSVGWGI